VGVGLLSGVHLSGDAVGVAWALAAGVGWAGYIVFGHRLALAADLRPQDGLAAGLAIGAFVLAPLFAWRTGRVFTNVDVFARAVIVAVSSTVVPYSLEQLAMRRLTRPRFAVMLALLPATATLMGVVVLGQLPSVADATGIALVIGAIWLTA
jgi:inner membrane transporter RhtA